MVKYRVPIIWKKVYLKQRNETHNFLNQIYVIKNIIFNYTKISDGGCLTRLGTSYWLTIFNDIKNSKSKIPNINTAWKHLSFC